MGRIVIATEALVAHQFCPAKVKPIGHCFTDNGKHRSFTGHRLVQGLKLCARWIKATLNLSFSFGHIVQFIHHSLSVVHGSTNYSDSTKTILQMTYVDPPYVFLMSVVHYM